MMALFHPRVLACLAGADASVLRFLLLVFVINSANTSLNSSTQRHYLARESRADLSVKNPDF
jgi:hypothetical protein